VTSDFWGNSDPDSPITPTTAYTHPDKGEKDIDNYTITISAKMCAASNPKTTRRLLAWPKRPSTMDKVKWAYFKVAMLFAVSILITWVPASVNRVYGLRYPENPSYALNIGSAIVLPLQGFWNTVIYFTTSLTICKKVFGRVRDGKEEKDSDGPRMPLDARVTPKKESNENEDLVELSAWKKDEESF